VISKPVVSALPAALGGARMRTTNLFTRMRVFLSLRRRGSRIPFFLRCNPAQFLDGGEIVIGRGVFVDRDAWFSVAPGATLSIGDNAHINRGFVVSCAGQVSIGRNVVMADRVFVGDTNHGYTDVSTPILRQPMSPPRRVDIEDDCWLGINVCVLSGVTIGRHSVIGANSVVTHDVPPFSVACGNPASVVKQYDPVVKQWTRTSGAG
jgi:acetyltransferase-like isoleucine patch superfamily enzyme